MPLPTRLPGIIMDYEYTCIDIIWGRKTTLSAEFRWCLYRGVWPQKENEIQPVMMISVDITQSSWLYIRYIVY